MNVGNYPELRAGGFSRKDGTVAFYTRVQSLCNPGSTVVDYGAGRGAYVDDPVEYRRRLRQFRGLVHRFIGVDVDPAVMQNPFIDDAFVIGSDERIPLADQSADVIFADFVLEHIATPHRVVAELHRVLKVGGWVCARTPNKYSLVGIITRSVPNRLHVSFLRRFQPHKKAHDTFPTQYKMNNLADLRAAFDQSEFDLIVVPHEPEFAYGSKNRFVKFVLSSMAAGWALIFPTVLLVFAQKRGKI